MHVCYHFYLEKVAVKLSNPPISHDLDTLKRIFYSVPVYLLRNMKMADISYKEAGDPETKTNKQTKFCYKKQELAEKL